MKDTIVVAIPTYGMMSIPLGLDSSLGGDLVQGCLAVLIAVLTNLISGWVKEKSARQKRKKSDEK